MENLSEKQMWLDAPTKLLISNLVELQPKVGKSAALKNKKKLWDLISEELKSNGYMFTPIQVETKFRSLERQYKKTKLNNKLTGRSKMTCPYESELGDLFGDKRGLNPDYILNNKELEGVCRNESKS
ncbi:zinc finger protein with KRAB and SCAN domains 2-like [Lucilia sericata]|uniref:zinc finger protein with KRAB and SCAN domains 2-like n=1 Tax=Lucilia sericata TaxID=13632 RepID=UPI0018A86803|nr:zinc finger protein with KRAB and SCAN domains 2-like [Lucilia sericata]